jgi:hypothetical protein
VMCKKGIPYPNGQCDVCGGKIGIGVGESVEVKNTYLRSAADKPYCTDTLALSANKNQQIHTDEKCIFNYCPTPEICREKGCQNPVERLKEE